MMDQEQNRRSSLIVTLLFLAAIVAMCAGCTTPPVRQKWPDAPKFSEQTCPQLEKLKEGAQLSDVAKTVTINYSTYYECAVKNDAWIEWYKIQKSIYEGTYK
jgi:hypothetical protein